MFIVMFRAGDVDDIMSHPYGCLPALTCVMSEAGVFVDMLFEAPFV